MGVIVGFSRHVFIPDCLWPFVPLCGGKLYEFDVAVGFLHISCNPFVDSYSDLCGYCICITIVA